MKRIIVFYRGEVYTSNWYDTISVITDVDRDFVIRAYPDCDCDDICTAGHGYLTDLNEIFNQESLGGLSWFSRSGFRGFRIITEEEEEEGIK